MSRRTTHLKLVGAAGAALAITGALAAPALAAGPASASSNYACYGGNVSLSSTVTVASYPAKLAVGQTAKLATTSQAVIDPASTTLAKGILGYSITGTMTTPQPSTPLGLSLTIDNTVLGNQPDGSTLATPHGVAIAKPTKTGSYPLAIGNFAAASLQGHNADGSNNGAPVPGGCVVPAPVAMTNSAGNAATIKVVKDKTTTSASGSYAKATKTVKATAKVKAHFKSKVTGKVRFVLMKGSAKVSSMTAKVGAKGVAKAAFPKVTKKATYTVKASYLGSKTLKTSNGSGTVKVG